MNRVKKVVVLPLGKYSLRETARLLKRPYSTIAKYVALLKIGHKERLPGMWNDGWILLNIAEIEQLRQVIPRGRCSCKPSQAEG